MIDRLRDILALHRGKLIGTGVFLLAIWIGFVDSHSLYKRARWHQEAQALRAENAELQAEIDRLRAELETDLTDEQVERISRQEYGMQREGETVHPVEPGD